MTRARLLRLEQSCPALAPILTPADQDYLNQAADSLDQALQNAAKAAGVNFVDVRPAFNQIADHAICGSGGSWLNGISFASGSGQPCTWMENGQCLWSGAPIIGSFHPNASGQSSGYAASIQAYINSATNLNAEGFPMDPAPDPPSDPAAATTTAPPVAVIALTVVPVTQGTASCEGTYQAGQTLMVSGSGFAPGAAVSLYVTSPGLGDTAEQQVGSATADANGNVSATIRIPLSATGFTPAGASAGLVFVDAIGLGTGGTHVDDTADAGLAPSTSSCGTVEQDSTTTSVTCAPGTVVLGQATTCTATITDTAPAGQATTPTGTVAFTSDTSGGTFTPGASCTLSATATTGQASCPVTYTPGQVGTGTQTITASYGGDVEHTASTGTVTVTVQPAPTTLVYTGPQSIEAGTGLVPTASLSSPVPACVSGQPVSFTLNANPATGAAGTYTLESATTNSAGTATGASISTSNWLAGAYTITAGYAGTANCAPSTAAAAIAVTTPGLAAASAGSYPVTGAGSVSFGFIVAKIPHTSAYIGGVTLVSRHQWQLTGILSNFIMSSSTQGQLTGTGSLYWWNPLLGNGHGGWQLAKNGVSFTAGFSATTKSAPGAFGVQISYTPVSPQPATLPNSAPVNLTSGAIVIA